MLKDLLVLLVTLDIGKHVQDDLEQLQDYEYQLLLVLYYVTLCRAMPLAVHQRFVQLVQKFFLDASWEEFLQQNDWLYISSHDWLKLAKVATFWVDENNYQPPLPSVQVALQTNIPTIPPTPDNLQDMTTTTGITDTTTVVQHLQAEQERQKRELEECKAQYLDIENWTPGVADALRDKHGQDKTVSAVKQT